MEDETAHTTVLQGLYPNSHPGPDLNRPFLHRPTTKAYRNDDPEQSISLASLPRLQSSTIRTAALNQQLPPANEPTHVHTPPRQTPASSQNQDRNQDQTYYMPVDSKGHSVYRQRTNTGGDSGTQPQRNAAPDEEPVWLKSLNKRIDGLREGLSANAESMQNLRLEVIKALADGNACPCLKTPGTANTYAATSRVATWAGTVKSSTANQLSHIDSQVAELHDRVGKIFVQMNSLSAELNEDYRVTSHEEARQLMNQFENKLEDLDDRVILASNNMLKQYKQAVDEVRDTAVDAINNLRNNGGCPCLSQGPSNSKGKERAIGENKTSCPSSKSASSHCESGRAAIEQLESNVATLTQIVTALAEAFSPASSDTSSNEYYEAQAGPNGTGRSRTDGYAKPPLQPVTEQAVDTPIAPANSTAESGNTGDAQAIRPSSSQPSASVFELNAAIAAVPPSPGFLSRLRDGASTLRDAMSVEFAGRWRSSSAPAQASTQPAESTSEPETQPTTSQQIAHPAFELQLPPRMSHGMLETVWQALKPEEKRVIRRKEQRARRSGKNPHHSRTNDQDRGGGGASGIGGTGGV